MKIIQICDLHITETSDMAICYLKADQLYGCVQNEIHGKEKIVLMVCGDVVDAKGVSPYSNAKKFFDYVKNKFKDINHEIIFVPGNHELKSDSFSEFDEFLKYVNGPGSYSYDSNNVIRLDIDGLCFVLVNSISHRDHKFGLIDIDQLRTCLTETPMPTVVVTHHTLFSRYVGDDSSIRNSYEVINELSRGPVIALFHGHTHGYSDVSVGEECKIIGCGPFLKQIPDVPNQFNIVSIVGDIVGRVDNFTFRGDVKRFSKDTLYHAKAIGHFAGTDVRALYNRVVTRTVANGCLNNFSMEIHAKAPIFLQNIEEHFSSEIGVARQWQQGECPQTLHYNHGMYFDRGSIGGIQYIINELTSKATSSRAILPLVNTVDVKDSGDGFFPSLDVIQFGFYDDSKTHLYVTIYLRALEVNHFLKINLAEIYVMVKNIQAELRSIVDLTIRVLAFRAQYREKFGCFQKAEIDHIEPEEITILVADKNVTKIKQLLVNKLELAETVIIDTGVTTLCKSLITFCKSHVDAYDKGLVDDVTILKQKYAELKELRTKTSIYKQIESKESEVTVQMQKIIASFGSMETTV